MELLGLTSYVCFAVALVALLAPLRTSFMLLVVTAPLTTVAAIDVGGSSVLIYHLVWLAFTVRFVMHEVGERARLDVTWLPFLLWCLCSIPLVLFHTDVLVLNIESSYGTPSLSFQQLTQWAYLLIAVSTAVYAEFLLRTGVVSVADLVRWLEAGLLLVLLVALLQLVLPVDTVNSYIRNSVHTAYTYNTSRLSSSFSEPSFLSAYIVPLVTFLAVLVVHRPSLRRVALIVCSLLLCLQNNSTSAVVGLAMCLVIVGLVLLGRSLTVRVPHGVYLVVVAAAAALMLAAVGGVFDDLVDTAVSKISGEGVSGTARSSAFSHMMGVFADNLFIGIGYGTVRSYDLVSTWLSELGVVGCALFFVPFVATVVRLARGAVPSEEAGLAQAVAAYLVVAMAIMLVSVPEPYFLSFWVVLGLARHLLERAEQEEGVALSERGADRARRRVLPAEGRHGARPVGGAVSGMVVR